MGLILTTIVGSLISSVFNTFNHTVDAGVATYQATTTATTAVITTAMGHGVFWLAWGIAAVPMSVWFGWGMLDTTFPGHLPNVAVIPPGLEPYAQAVWANIFYTGGAVAVAQSGFTALSGIFGKRE